MKTELKTAKEMFQDYHKKYHELVNIYCQAKDKNPFSEYLEIAKAICRTGVCAELWRAVAIRNAERRYYEGG